MFDPNIIQNDFFYGYRGSTYYIKDVVFLSFFSNKLWHTKYYCAFQPHIKTIHTNFLNFMVWIRYFDLALTDRAKDFGEDTC